MFWWERFGLVRPPNFKHTTALSVDDADLFVSLEDQEMTNKIFSLLDDPNLFFGKVYAIAGKFGSGKTTLVNYIRYNFLAKGIKTYPADIQWYARNRIESPTDVRTWFIQEIRDELLEACEGARATPNTTLNLHSLNILKNFRVHRRLLSVK